MNSQITSRQVLLVYFALCLYHLGEVLMTYFVNYAEMVYVKENVRPVMEVFNQQMLKLSHMPMVLMVLATFSLHWFAPKAFPKWSVWASIGLAILSIIVAFVVVKPIQMALPQTGLTPEIQAKLLPMAFYGQVVPAILQILLRLWFLNSYFGSIKPLPRWAYLVVFCMAFFTAGTGTIEGFVAYPMWREVGATDWLAFRGGVSTLVFFGIFLIPGYLPMILSVLMFWHRPVGIPKWSVWVIIGLIVYVFVVTAIYFVPDLQMKLDKGYSKPLIDELIANDFPYRGWAGNLYILLVGWLFLKITLNPQPLPHKSF